MQQHNTWLLPEGIEEILPEEAKFLEQLRHNLLRLFASWGYDLVIPPMIDFMESLLTGSGYDLDLQTFKLTDQVSGKTLGLRADMTPQVARMDAHHLNHSWPTRLCYVGTVLHTRGDPLEKTRSPMQIGAELYGHAGIESDVEVIQLMLESLAFCELEGLHLDLGHVGIFGDLAEQAGLDSDVESDLFDILQRKAKPELADSLSEMAIKPELKRMILALPELNGGQELFPKARELLSSAGQTVINALDDLENIAAKIGSCYPQVPITFDLAELRGYHYHTGVVFAAFVPSLGREIARGGRYDNIGEFFGRARPATGFSADLKTLALLSKQDKSGQATRRIFAPYQVNCQMNDTIRRLRAEGCCIIQQLPGQTGSAQDMGCNAQLVQVGEDWQVKSI